MNRVTQVNQVMTRVTPINLLILKNKKKEYHWPSGHVSVIKNGLRIRRLFIH
jgi:hypothetical protein